MITDDQAWNLVMEYAYSKTSALNNSSSYVSHVGSVAARCYGIAWNLFKKGHDVDPDFTRRIGIVHDIGRTVEISYRDGNDIHEFCTGEILRKEGFPEEANAAQRHFVAFEKATDILIPIYNLKINPEDYKQINLPEMILTYVDSSVGSDGALTIWKKRLLEEVIPKYEKKNNIVMVKILKEGGLERVKGICEGIDRLLE